MFQKIAKHRANDASNDVHRPPLRATLLFPFLYGSSDFIFHFDVLKEDLVELELLEMVIVLLGDVLT